MTVTIMTKEAMPKTVRICQKSGGGENSPCEEISTGPSPKLEIILPTRTETADPAIRRQKERWFR